MPVNKKGSGTLGGPKDPEMDEMIRNMALESQRQLGRGSAASKLEGKKVSTGTSRRGKSDAELGFVDDVEVRRADGTTTTLGAIDPDPAPEVETTAPRKSGGAKKNITTKPVRGGSAAAVNSAAMKKLQAQLDAATKKASKVEADAKAKLEAERKKTAEAKKAAAEAKKLAAQEKKELAKKEREEKAEARKAEIIAKREAAQAAKARAKGETGDEAVDAAFHEAQSLAIQPFDVSSVQLGFAGIPGVSYDRVGITLPEQLAIQDWTNLTAGFNAIDDVAGFVLGDLLLYADSHYGAQGAILAEDIGIAKQRAKDLKWIAGTFPKQARVQGLSITHHQEAAGLFTRNPAKALNILQEAVAHDPRPLPALWVRQQVKAVDAESGVVGPTKEEKRVAERDSLVLAANEQREKDLAELSPEELASAEMQERRAVLEYAQYNDVVPSETAVRVIARLQGLLYEAQNEAAHYKQLYQDLMAQYGKRDEAAARVAEYGTNGTADTGDFIAQDDLSFLDTNETVQHNVASWDAATSAPSGESVEDEES